MCMGPVVGRCGRLTTGDTERHRSYLFASKWDGIFRFCYAVEDRFIYCLFSLNGILSSARSRIAWMAFFVYLCVWFIDFNHRRRNNSSTNMCSCSAVVLIFRSTHISVNMICVGDSIAFVRCLVRLFRTFDPTKTKNCAVNGWPFFMYHLIVAEP